MEIDLNNYLRAIKHALNIISCKYPDPECQIIRNIIDPQDLVVDIGASTANWTSFLSKCVGRKGRVYAFEADQTHYKMAKLTLFLLGKKNVSLHNIALSNINKKGYLQIYNESGQRLQGRTHLTEIKHPDTQSVTLSRLDDFAKKEQGINSATFIKCDVEGHELMVMQGADSLIKNKTPTILLETGHEKRFGYEPVDISRFLKSKGYECYALNRFLELMPVDENLQIKDPISSNRLFIHRKNTYRLARK